MKNSVKKMAGAFILVGLMASPLLGFGFQKYTISSGTSDPTVTPVTLTIAGQVYALQAPGIKADDISKDVGFVSVSATTGWFLLPDEMSQSLKDQARISVEALEGKPITLRPGILIAFTSNKSKITKKVLVSSDVATNKLVTPNVRWDGDKAFYLPANKEVLGDLAAGSYLSGRDYVLVKDVEGPMVKLKGAVISED